MQFLEYVLYFILVVLVFGVLIFIHELGHFLMARLCGVGVKEFAIGMGPTVFSVQSKKHGTKYGLRLFPIGGFVSMVGEDESSEEENAFCNKSVWKRMLIVATGPAMNLILGFLLMTIIVFSQGTPVSTTIAKFSDTAVSQEKLQVGDEILSIDCTPVHTGHEVLYEIMNQGYEPIDIKVKRNGEKILVENVSFGSTSDETGVNFGEIDFSLYAEESNFFTLLKHSFFRSLSTMKMVIDSVVGMITGRFGIESVSGPVGTAGMIGDAAKQGILTFLYIMSALSINLGMFNLFPFPALDGGRFLFLIIEGIRRKPINKNVESYINFAGIVILLAFMVLITAKDVFQLFS